MPRARFLRPEFFDDEKVGAVPFGARLLFQCMWVHSDLQGVCEWSPARFRGLAFRFDGGVTPAQIEEWKNSLVDQGMVQMFTANGKSWCFLPHFTTHQSFTSSETKLGSRNPSPPQIKSLTQVRPESDPSQTRVILLSPSPSPSPEPEPAPPPTPAPARRSAPAPAPGSDDDPRLVVAAAAGGYLTWKTQDVRPEWIAVFDELHLDREQVAAALGRLRLPDGNRIRLPTGLRTAFLAEIQALEAAKTAERERQAAAQRQAAEEQHDQERRATAAKQAAATLDRWRSYLAAIDRFPDAAPPPDTPEGRRVATARACVAACRAPLVPLAPLVALLPSALQAEVGGNTITAAP